MIEDNDLLIRIATLEVQGDYMKDSLDEQKVLLHEVSSKVNGIQEHLARQNGTIPHMNENLNLLSGDFKSFKDSYATNEVSKAQSKITSLSDKKDIEEAADSRAKLRIIWGLAIAILTLAGHTIIRLLFHV